MASPASIRELRFVVSSTHRTLMMNAGADGPEWNISAANVEKLRVTAVDVTGLTQPGLDDETLQTRMHAKPPMIEGMAIGTIKLSAYAGGAYANVDVGPEWNLAQCMAGGINIPSNRSALVDTATSTTNSGIADIGTALGIGRGMCGLIGSRGDGRGGGEVKPINAITTDTIQWGVATSVAAGVGDTVVFGTTLYPDENATQRYADFYVLGHAAADQHQVIGCAGPWTLSGTAIGEVPKLDFEPVATDWENPASGSRASLQHGTAPRGGVPAFDKGIGLAHIGDMDSNTRVTYKVTDVVFNPGLVYEPIPSQSGVNGIGGHQHMPGVPTLECTILTAEDDGLLDDFPSQAKTVLIQMGHEATKCICIELREAYLDAKPTRVEVNNLTGWRLVFHGTEDYVSSNELESAAWRVHIF